MNFNLWFAKRELLICMLFNFWPLNYSFVCITIYCLYRCLWDMFFVWWSFDYVDIWFDLIYDLYLYFIITAMSQYRPVIEMKYHFKFCFCYTFWNNRKLSFFFHIEQLVRIWLIPIFNLNYLRQKRNKINEVFRWKNK